MAVFQMSKYTLCTQDMTISMELNLAYKLGMGIFVYKYTPKFIFVNSYFATTRVIIAFANFQLHWKSMKLWYGNICLSDQHQMQRMDLNNSMRTCCLSLESERAIKDNFLICNETNICALAQWQRNFTMCPKKQESYKMKMYTI